MSYDPTLILDLAEIVLIFANNNLHWAYVVVTVVIDEETGEQTESATIEANESHIDPLQYWETDGKIHYKIGYFGPVMDGKREAHLLWNLTMDNSGGENLHSPVSIADNSKDKASIDENQVLTINNQNTDNVVVVEKDNVLYNFNAIVSGAGFCPPGWHVSTKSEWETILNNIDVYDSNNELWPQAGGKLKETGFNYWLYPNTGATNEFNFTALGSGIRANEFSGIKEITAFASSSEYTDDNSLSWILFMFYSEEYTYMDTMLKQSGVSVRLVKDNEEWQEGETLTDYDGNVYQTVKIGNKVWITSNWACKHYADGTPIPGPQFTNDEWNALTTGAYCYYTQTLRNYINSLQHNELNGLQGGDYKLSQFYHLSGDQVQKIHNPVTIAADSVNKATIDENQELHILINSTNENLTTDTAEFDYGFAKYSGEKLHIFEELEVTTDPHNPLLLDASDSGEILICCGMYPYISHDSGATWQQVLYQSNWGPAKISGDGQIMVVCNRGTAQNDGAIHISEDSGATWANITPPIATLDFYTLRISQNGNSIIIGVNNGGVYKTTDKGATWQQLTALGVQTGIPSWAGFAISNDGEHILVCKRITYGSFTTLISVNGGTNFIDFWDEIGVAEKRGAIAMSIAGDKSLAAFSVGSENANQKKSLIFFRYGLNYRTDYDRVEHFKSSVTTISFIDRNVQCCLGLAITGLNNFIGHGRILIDDSLVYFRIDMPTTGQLGPLWSNVSGTLIYCVPQIEKDLWKVITI